MLMIEKRRSHNFGFGLVDAVVTNMGGVVDAWIHGVVERHHPGRDIVVGLECKWSYNVINTRPTTLQLCVGSRCILIELVHLDGITSSLSRFLASPNVVFVGVDVDRNVKKLKSEYGITVVRTEDLWDVAAYLMPHRIRGGCPELKTLAREVVDLHMPKPEFAMRKNWLTAYLDDEQIESACLDAYASCMVGMRLL